MLSYSKIYYVPLQKNSNQTPLQAVCCWILSYHQHVVRRTCCISLETFSEKRTYLLGMNIGRFTNGWTACYHIHIYYSTNMKLHQPYTSFCYKGLYIITGGNHILTYLFSELPFLPWGSYSLCQGKVLTRSCVFCNLHSADGPNLKQRGKSSADNEPLGATETSQPAPATLSASGFTRQT